MLAMRNALFAALILSGCTRPNPDRCCTGSEDCSSIDLPTTSECADGFACNSSRVCVAGDAGTGFMDAASLDAPSPASVTVSVINVGVGVRNATVYFLDPDGTPAGEVVTDANGSASHSIATGGSITAVIDTAEATASTSGSYLLFTIEGVKPGDQLW